MCRIQSFRVVMNGGYAHVEWWSMMDMFMRRAGQWWICSCEYVAGQWWICSCEYVAGQLQMCSCVIVANSGYAPPLAKYWQKVDMLMCSSGQWSDIIMCSSGQWRDMLM